MTVNDLIRVITNAHINFIWFDDHGRERQQSLYLNYEPITKIEQFSLEFMKLFGDDHVIEIYNEFGSMYVVIDKQIPDYESRKIKERAYAKVMRK